MNDETFSGVPVIHKAPRALASEIGWRQKDQQRQRQAAELEAQEQEHQRRGREQHGQQAGERLLLRPGTRRPAPSGSRAGISSLAKLACSLRLTLPRSLLAQLGR